MATGLAATLPLGDMDTPGSGRIQNARGLVLGAQTHFAQGWLLPWMDRARELGAPSLRDGLSWRTIETRPGRYRFDPYYCDFLEAARRKRLDLLLCIDPRHPAYDDGDTAFSPEARAAFAAYVAALLDRYGDVVSAIEVGNEINSQRSITGPAATDRAASHVALLRTLHDRVKPDHPDVLILGGSTNAIGIGFLEDIFAAGGLEVMDGVAVHPYRSHAEFVDVELAALTEVMARHGPVRPIFATEFSHEFATPELASPHMVKMFALMGASNVARAYWYAVADQRWFRNMGLFTTQQQRKPAGETFAFIQAALAPLGRPTAVAEDPMAHVYRYETGATVLWGTPRPIRVSGAGRAHDARGRAIPMPTAMAEDPVVILGDVQVEVPPALALADSFHQFGQPPWSYFVSTPDGAPKPLQWVRWTWTSYIGDRRFQPLAFNPRTLAPGAPGRSPVRALLRYTAPADQKVLCNAWFSHAREGDGVTVDIRRSGDVAASATLTVCRSEQRSSLGFDLRAGDAIDILVGPGQTFGGDMIDYHILILNQEA